MVKERIKGDCMNISFASSGTVNYVWQNNLPSLNGSDVTIFGANGLGLVSYKKELCGETEYFQDVARLSRQISGVVVSGCDTDTYGVFRHSAVISDKGKILGVSDMIYSLDDSEFIPGSGNRVYDTSKGKIGIIISDDLFFPEISESLSSQNADLIICLFKKTDGYMPLTVARALSYMCGVNFACVFGNVSFLCDIKGNVISSNSPLFKANTESEKEFRMVTLKKRGVYKDFGIT